MNEMPDKSGELVKLTGTIRHYKCTRDTASFVFTDADRTRMRVMGIAGLLASLGGSVSLGAASAANLSNASNTEEEADYVEFDLDGQPVKGWVWRSPFKEGDKVEVAAEWVNNHYEARGIARPSDRMIALYPHCSRGKMKHIKNSLKWGGYLLIYFFIGFEVLSILISSSVEDYLYDFFSLPHFVVEGGIALFFCLMVFSLNRKWMPFVRLSEKVFRTLGLPDPGNIDLVKSSKAQRKPTDPGEFGTFYFRY